MGKTVQLWYVVRILDENSNAVIKEMGPCVLEKPYWPDYLNEHPFTVWRLIEECRFETKETLYPSQWWKVIIEKHDEEQREAKQRSPEVDSDG